MAWIGALVSAAVVAMKVAPSVAGSFTRAEWIAFLLWSALGAAFWMARPRRSGSAGTS